MEVASNLKFNLRQEGNVCPASSRFPSYGSHSVCLPSPLLRNPPLPSSPDCFDCGGQIYSFLSVTTIIPIESAFFPLRANDPRFAHSLAPARLSALPRLSPGGVSGLSQGKMVRPVTLVDGLSSTFELCSIGKNLKTLPTYDQWLRKFGRI